MSLHNGAIHDWTHIYAMHDLQCRMQWRTRGVMKIIQVHSWINLHNHYSINNIVYNEDLSCLMKSLETACPGVLPVFCGEASTLHKPLHIRPTHSRRAWHSSLPLKPQDERSRLNVFKDVVTSW